GERAPREDEPRLEQRQVEARAVVRHDPVEPADQRVDRAEQGRLLVEVAHEVLPDLERVPVEEARADEEGIGPGAAGQTRGLRIEGEGPRPRRSAGAREQGEALRGDVPRGVERLTPVAMAEVEATAHGQDAATLHLLDRAAHRLLERDPPVATGAAALPPHPAGDAAQVRRGEDGPPRGPAA